MAKSEDQNLVENARLLGQVQWIQASRSGQNKLYPNAGTQSLTWDVIFLIAEAQFAGKDINVSDVCVSVTASKSTVLKLIAQLVANKIVTKRRKENDTRTHLLRLHDAFQRKLEAYLDETVAAVPKK